MKKRDERRRLEVRREEIRALTALRDEQVRLAAGGGFFETVLWPDGRIGSRCCN